jgi:hypothetical protein
MKYFNLEKIYFYYTMIIDDMIDNVENIYMRCDICNYETNHSGDFNKHLMTNKHQKNVRKLKMEEGTPMQKYECVCGKKYKYSSGLSRHKKECEECGYQRENDPTIIRQLLEIQTTQNELNRLSKEKLPLMKEENKLTAEIGPIKYIAEIFYNKDDPSFIDKAVRLVIFTIIIVFDPLAILLLIAANQTYKRFRGQDKEQIVPIKKAKKKKKVDNTASNTLESFYVDGEMHEVIPKSKITTLDGGQF